MEKNMKLNKILIIGISGTGKTWLAKKLSGLLNIPVTHYDQLVWGKNWTEVDEKIVEQKLAEIVKTDHWIIEGFIHPAARVKLEQADVVIYLDYSGAQALWGGLKRWWQCHGRTRPEMAPGCIEEFNWRYLKTMYTRAERPEIETAIKGFENKVIRLKNKKTTADFLAKINKTTNSLF